jgi:hypothetical protein
MSSLTLVNENGLSIQQAQFAKEIGEKHTEVVILADQVRQSEGDLKAKYVALCTVLRASGLNGRECTLLLQSRGFIKQRITEIKKVCSVDDVTWAKYVQGDIGRQVVLKIARGGSDNVDEVEPIKKATVSDDAGEAQEEEAPVFIKVTPLVDPVLGALAKLLKKHELAPGKHTAMIDIKDYGVQILFTVKGKN